MKNLMWGFKGCSVFVFVLSKIVFPASAMSQTGSVEQTIRAHTDWSYSGRLPLPSKEKIPATEPSAMEHTLAVFYVVPSDIPYEESIHQRIIDATLDIQGWYQCATGGLTWKLAFPEVVQVYFAEQTREYYLNNGNWWGSLLGEMGSGGLPIWSPGTVTAIWAHGAGWWAGGAQGCGAECGVALFGVEVFPEFNNPEWSGGECPGGQGGAAWPCTPEGAFAHELGHTVGLPHPFDVPETREHAFHSVMQTHWNYSDFAQPSESPWGFLTLERQRIRPNRFMHSDITLFQSHPSCDVVNLPPNGPSPTAAFEIAIEGLTVSLTNTSEGATLFYWTFGDGEVSNDVNPLHTYVEPGAYVVTLRSSSDNSMIDRVDLETNVGP